jgi:putative ABC transport system ATP-binding protein
MMNVGAGAIERATTPIEPRDLGHADADGLPIIEVSGLHKSYRSGAGRTSVLNDLDLQVAAGETVALEGPSGSGKSTLLNILGCLDRPTSGHYWLGGTDVSSLSREAQAWVRLHFIGFVFQSFHLIAHATALENVALPLQYAGARRRERFERAQALLEQVNLADHGDHRPHEMSGGERQRVALARALACHPRLLLADEPTGALDSRTGTEILDLILALQRKEGLTVVIVTHDPRIAALADRRVSMLDGRIVARGEDHDVAQ